MYTLNINGRDVVTEEDKKLLDFLREDLNITSVKNGCNEGACGACTIIVDGKAIKACVQKVSKFSGKKIVTVEGLSKREKEVYVYCFAEAGAVQCGFCIPGMIMSAKALLDVNLNPTVEDVKKAIRGNICRCTGYKKIEEAILNAAKYFRENLKVPAKETTANISERFNRVDAEAKILGTGKYVDDLRIDGMAYAKALRSKYPRARINKIDVSKAKNHPDCVAVLTAKDVPNNKIGHLVQDWDVMIQEGDTTRYIGDALALVVTNHAETLDEVLGLIDVEYTVLEPLTSPFDALKPGAPVVHYEKGAESDEHKEVKETDFGMQKLEDGTLLDFESPNIMRKEVLNRGDVDGAIKASKYVVTRRYSTPFQEHGFMEPECAVAMPEGEDGLLLYTSSQSVYDEQREISNMLKIAPEKVHSHAMLVGGGFGGKEDMSVQHHAALAAYITKRPVKVKFSRQESLNYHTKRHAMEMEFTTACDENGKLTAMKALIIADTGAYASLGGPVLQRACTHAAGPYNYQNIDIIGMSVYTNNVVGGAFRGFGVTQSCFATENNINLLAEMVGISPWEFRYKNAIRPGEVLPNGQIADDSTAMVECLEAVKDEFESHPYAGIACGFKNSGTGVGLKDIGRCLLSVEKGLVHIRTSASCMGQGIATMCTHMLCETTGLDPNLTFAEAPDTIRTPNAGTSTASRQTVLTGEATRRASVKLALALIKKLFGEDLEELDEDTRLKLRNYCEDRNNDGKVKKALEGLNGEEYFGEFSAVTDPMGSPKKNPVSHVSYSYATQVVEIDENGKLLKVVAAYDVGTVVNPQSVEGQIEGGIVMGLGYAMTENFKIKGGYPQIKFGTLGLMRSTDVPQIEVKLVHGKGKIPQAYGAKGVGELCLIPTAPACSHAYYRLDGKLRCSLPLKDTFYKKPVNK